PPPPPLGGDAPAGTPASPSPTESPARSPCWPPRAATASPLRATPTPSTESGRGSTAGAPAPAPEPGGRRPSPPPNTMPALYGSPAPADLPGATAPLESAEHYNWPPCLAGTPASCSPADAALPALATQDPTPGTLDLRRKDGMNDTSTATPAPESLRDR